MVNDDREQQFNVSTTSEAHVVGHHGEDNYYARWYVKDNKLIANGAKSTSSGLITQIDRFGLVELQTNDKSYTKFKYIQ